VLLVVTVAASLFDRALNSYPSGRITYPSEFPSILWFVQVGVVFAFVAVLFWSIAEIDPRVWRALAQVFGWEEEEEKPSPTGKQTLPSLLEPNAMLECPSCRSKGPKIRHQALTSIRHVEGITVFGRDFGFVSEKPVEKLWCEQCGYVLLRKIEG
jgi:hypothetical protein